MPYLPNLIAPSRSIAALAVVLCVWSGSSARAESTAVTIGIDGHYRVGSWAGIRVNESRFTSIETRDGDGVQVQYRQDPTVTQQDHQWGYVIPGSEAAPLVIRRDKEIVASTRFPTIGSPSRAPAMIPLTMPWILVFGDPLGVDRIGANELLGRDAMVAVSAPSSAEQLPDSVLGYDGIDIMIIGGGGTAVLSTLSQQQQRSLSQWITDGGRVFLTLGQSTSELLAAAPWLAKLLPIDDPVTVTIDPSAIETYTSTQTPLKPFVGVKLPKDKGRVLVMGRTNRRISTPIASEYNVGFGKITVIAADLDSELFALWPERHDLITQLTGSLLIPEQRISEGTSRATAYNDLAGQLRATLDRFSVKRTFGFSFIALVLMLLIAAIGPLDYLLINRLFGRPLLGWLSFPLVAIGLSALLVAQSRVTPGEASAASPNSSQGPALQCHRLEIFDIDTMQNTARGFNVNYLYTHEATLLDVNVNEGPTLQAISAQMQQQLTIPFGYPGESFGGIQIAIEDARLPVYQVAFEQDLARTRTSLLGMPLAPRSSKGFAGQFSFVPKLASDVTMQRRPGSELLQGELSNPLPADLLDGMLIYRNWVYLLPTRFSAQSRIASVDSLRQKNFRWMLSRQKALESATETEAWNTAAHDSPLRVAEMLMFHDAVGGTQYTTLQHRPLSLLDLSHVLAEDRCILLGRLAKPLTEIQIHDHQSAALPGGQTLTLVRVVLPVETARTR